MIFISKLLLRNITDRKSFTAINIIGLAIGFACALAVIVRVKYEFSYDRFLPDSGRIYRLTFETNVSGNRIHFARCWEKWISQLPGSFPQVEELVRLAPYRHTAVKAGENKFYSDRIFATDSNFFKVFGIGTLPGNVDKLLTEPYSAVISASLAKKCFGNSDPVGQTIFISGEYDEKMTLFNIKGVMNDSPDNSHIHFDIVTSFEKPEESPDWAYVYLLLQKNANPDEVLEGLPSFIKKAEKDNDQIAFTPYLQKITDIHLYSDKDREIEQNSNITSICLYVIIALILLLVSWVNYFNLSKAKLLMLQKQVFILRITGSDKWHIIVQSLAQSGLCVISALALAVFLLDIFAKPACSLLGFSLLPDGFADLSGIWLYVLIILVISVLSGSLPLIINVLTWKNSISVIREIAYKKQILFSSHGILITFQFILSIGLIISAITIYNQKELILSGSLRKMSSDILVFKRQNWAIRSRYKAFSDKSLQNPLIKNFSASLEEPTGETLDAMQVESSAIDENHKNRQLYVLSVEDNFLDFFNLQLVAGRTFTRYSPDRKGEDYILNETAVKLLGWTPEEAIGKPFKINFNIPDIFYGGTVVGVVKDFNFNTLKQEIKPYVLFQKPIFYLCFLVEVNHERRNEAITYLRDIWEKELPDYPFQYELVSDLYDSAYRKEFTQAKVTGFFSFLAIFIVCLGLYSVTSVLVTRRTKEIGIRKVNGARVKDIILMLSSEFMVWFVIAFIISCPTAWLVMNKWLQNFAYRTEMKWWIFAIAGILVLSVSLLTVWIKTWRAATVNPVKALRYE